MSEVSEKLNRISVPLLDEILGVPFRVLDDGFVRVVDYMGNDSSIVQAARVSYGTGTKRISEDRGLIRYLMRHWHTTPFEMCEIKLHVRVPMDCWRQWIRHRTANVNEYSTRYSEAIDACQKTPPEEWRLQSELNKQGSGGNVVDWPQGEGPISLKTDDIKLELDTPGKYLSYQEETLQRNARDLYEERLKYGVAREQARKDLPLSTYTEAYWKVDLHNLFHFLRLRMDSHAQKEIRDYACTIGEKIVKPWCPLAWEAYMDYQFGASHLSRMEMEIIGAMAGGQSAAALQLAEQYGWLDKNDKGALKTNRERVEVEAKLKKLNLNIPW